MANKERKHLRLCNWNYSSEGVYFITLCCNNRQSSFGQIQNNKVTLSMIGEIASQYWLNIPDHFSHVKIDEFVVMPNHIHGIIMLDYSLVGPRHGVALHIDPGVDAGSCHGMTLQNDPSWMQCRTIVNNIYVILP